MCTTRILNELLHMVIRTSHFCKVLTLTEAQSTVVFSVLQRNNEQNELLHSITHLKKTVRRQSHHGKIVN